MKENSKINNKSSKQKKQSETMFQCNPRKIKNPKDPISKQKKKDNLAEALRLNLLRRKEIT
jgi:hypothetical protein